MAKIIWIFLAVFGRLEMAFAKFTMAEYFYNRDSPLLIAHRGASGIVPEHTLQAYDLAVFMGADFIELDLVPTADHNLLIRHEGLLNLTTDIEDHKEYAYLYTTKTTNTYEGDFTENGWFSEDFYLFQIKELRALQRVKSRPGLFNNVFELVTLSETLDWLIGLNKDRILHNKTLIGAYIELKNPDYYNSRGFPMEEMLLDVLKNKGVDSVKGASAKCPIILQNFELESLKFLSNRTDLPLVYLVELGFFHKEIDDFKDIVHGIGPNLPLVLNTDGSPKELVREAQENRLAVHGWGLKNDKLVYGWNQSETYRNILKTSMNGVFDDFPKISQIYFNR